LFMKFRTLTVPIVVLCAFLFATEIVNAQTSIPSSTPVVQNFNAIGSTATASLPANWKMSAAAAGLTGNYSTGVTATTQAASTGTPTTGGRYNWATTAGTDRAIGFMTDGSYASPNSIIGYYRNTTGGYIDALTISFSIERYVINTNTVSVAFYTSTNGTSWTAQTAGDVPASAFTTGSVAYLFDGPTAVSKTVTLSNLGLGNNGDIYVRWVFTNTGNTSAQGLGLDDVTLTANTAVPLLTANLGDHLTDANSNGAANPRETLTYRDTIKNSGSADALNVALTSLAPIGTIYKAGTIKSSALAIDDNYTTAANPTVLNVSTAGTGVLNNDYGLPSVTVATFGPTANGATTAAGSVGTTDAAGTLTVNATGTFTYTPAAGFTGIDQFKYIATTSVGLPDNDAIVSIAVGTTATATADAYPVTGNVSITIAAPGVLSNDAGTGTKTVTSVNGSTSNVGVNVTTGKGGTLNIAADGSFTYDPPAGYEGTDVISYTVDNGLNQPSSSTITFTISGMIWFVNNAAVTNGDGRLSSPFKLLSDFTGAALANNPAANDNIFLYESGSSYTGPITLLSGQKLIGQDATTDLATLTGLTLANGSASLPAMNTGGNTTTITSLGTTVSLNTGNAIYGLTLGNATTSHLVGSSFGTLTVKDVTIVGSGQAMSLTTGAFAATSAFTSVTSTSSGTQGINLSGVTGSVAFGSTTISGATTQGILVGTTTADINFGNTTVTANSDGVSLQNNSSGTRTFGTLTITVPGANVGFLHAAGGGGVSAGTTIIDNSNTGTGNGIDISNPNAAISFGATTVNKLGAGIAIDLGNTSTTNANVTFTSVTAGTSGTRLTGQGISIINTGGTNTSVYDFGAVSIYTNAATAFTGTNVDGTINTSSGIIDALTASAVNISGPAGNTTLGMTLTALNSTGGTNNVVLNSTTGTATFNGGALSGSTANAFDVTNGSPVVTYAGTITNATAKVVSIVNTTGGNKTFSGNLTSTGTGLTVSGNSGTSTILFSGGTKSFTTGANTAVNLATNTGCFINFSNGGLAITTTTAVGFNATGGGTVTVTTGANNNTISSTTGIALNVNSTTIGASGLTFKSIASGSAANGIVLNTTGSSGGLTVTGDGASDAANTTKGRITAKSGGGTLVLGSGGTLSATTGAAISLTSTSGVVLRNMIIQNGASDGIAATSVTGLTVDNTLVTGKTLGYGLHATTTSAITIVHSEFNSNATAASVPAADIRNVGFDNVTGTHSITHSLFQVAAEHVVVLKNTTGTTTFNVTNCTFSGAQAGDGLDIYAYGTSNVTANIQGTTCSGNSAFGFDSGTETTQSGSLNLTINGCFFTNNFVGLDVAHGSSGSNTFNITNNTFTTNVASSSQALNINRLGHPSFTGFGLFTGTISGNIIGNAAVPNSGSDVGDGITVQTNGNGGINRFSILNNTIRSYGQHGIHVSGVDATTGHTLEVKIQNNNIANGEAVVSLDGINVGMGALNTDKITMCLNIMGNTVVTPVRTGIRVRSSGLPAANVTLTLPAYDGSGATYFANQNPGVSGSTSFSNASGTTSAGNCNTP
jgi:hypothetical protein